MAKVGQKAQHEETVDVIEKDWPWCTEQTSVNTSKDLFFVLTHVD